MTKLKNINFGLNQYCGPAVLSALTGKSTDECAAVINSISGKKEIKAVNIEHLIKAFEKLRFSAEKIHSSSYTLYGNLLNLTGKNGFYIITGSYHVVAVEVNESEIYIIDNHSRQPVNAGASARLSQRVDQIYKIVPKEQPKSIRSEIEVDRQINSIYLYCHNIYEDSKDNTKYSIGTIRSKDDKELLDIFQKLEEVYVQLRFGQTK